LTGDSLTFVVKKKGGEYCKDVKKKNFISLDPPPEPSSVVVVKRKYSSLARDLIYQKRVTWFEMSPELPVAVVEYIGSYPTNTNVHGNAKHISAPYRRTTTQQKTAIRKGWKNNKSPKEIREGGEQSKS
jgi:hypothetical protein